MESSSEEEDNQLLDIFRPEYRTEDQKIIDEMKHLEHLSEEQ